MLVDGVFFILPVYIFSYARRHVAGNSNNKNKTNKSMFFLFSSCHSHCETSVYLITVGQRLGPLVRLSAASIHTHNHHLLLLCLLLLLLLFFLIPPVVKIPRVKNKKRLKT